MSPSTFGSWLVLIVNICHTFPCAFAKICGKATVIAPSVSVCPSAWKNSAHTGLIFMKFDNGIYFFFENKPV